MCLCLSISETLVGTLADTSDSGFVAFDVVECELCVEPIIFVGVAIVFTFTGVVCWVTA